MGKIRDVSLVLFSLFLFILTLAAPALIIGSIAYPEWIYSDFDLVIFNISDFSDVIFNGTKFSAGLVNSIKGRSSLDLYLSSHNSEYGIISSLEKFDRIGVIKIACDSLSLGFYLFIPCIQFFHVISQNWGMIYIASILHFVSWLFHISGGLNWFIESQDLFGDCTSLPDNGPAHFCKSIGPILLISSMAVSSLLLVINCCISCLLYLRYKKKQKEFSKTSKEAAQKETPGSEPIYLPDAKPEINIETENENNQNEVLERDTEFSSTPANH